MNKIRCIYCLKDFDTIEITDEDFWPISWHINKKQNTPKWIVPACYQCNQTFSKLEGKLLRYFGLNLNPEEGTFKQIAQKAVRAFNPDSARNDKDRRCRQNNFNNLMNNIVSAAKIPKESVLPSFEPIEQYEGADGEVIAREDIIKFGEKLIRGAIYYFYKQYVEKTRKIDVSRDGEPYCYDSTVEVIKEFPYLDNSLNGLHVISAYDCNSRSGVIALEIWDKHKLVAFIQPL